MDEFDPSKPKKLKPQVVLPTKVVIGLSGGIRSAVAAAILKEQGYDLVGIHVKLGGENTPKESKGFRGHCFQYSDEPMAKKIAKRIGIELHVVNANDQFSADVVDPLIMDSIQGRVPAPCLNCHVKVRLAAMVQLADSLSISKVATGHFAQTISDPVNDEAHLLRSVEVGGDRSYFLYTVSMSTLKRLLMPVGSFSNKFVEKLAIELGLVQDGLSTKLGSSSKNCFIDEPGFKDFVNSRVAPVLRQGGDIKNTKRDVIAHHEGIHTYRIGQDVSQQFLDKKNPDDKKYVLMIDRVDRTIMVGEDKFLLQGEAFLRNLNWLQPIDGLKPVDITAFVIGRSTEGISATVTLLEGKSAHVRFDEPERGLQAGNHLVFYRGDELLGGGMVDRVVTAQSVAAEQSQGQSDKPGDKSADKSAESKTEKN